jgi:hypothetical protein
MRIADFSSIRDPGRAFVDAALFFTRDNRQEKNAVV